MRHINRSRQKMKGQFHRDASNRKTYEVFELPGDLYIETADMIVRQFELKRVDRPVTNAVDVIFCGYSRGEAIVQFAWDNWSGFFVTALNTEAEPLVDTIGQFMEQQK
jgi:hypothetical protein